ncbi:MAG TPA: Imm26 family immunity protein [Sphingomonadaceae bacterium]|nr:Imm26 family immunity protein [Sphingomonadaceae bacterium]
MSLKVQVGDVFLVPVDSSRFGIGQVAGDWKGELYIIIYDGIHSGEDVDPKSVTSEKPLFAALSLDAKIHNGDWRVVGNVLDNVDDIPQPVFKVSQGDEIFVESRDRTVSRPASSEEVQGLNLRTVVAPVRLENALKAYYGLGVWNPKYDELRADNAFRSSQVVRL